MELMAEEKKLTATDSEWARAYNRHYASVKKAVDQLAGGMGGIDTEGELTFEDGMITCTALQLEAFALLQDNVTDRERYFNVAKTFLESHRCLTQLLVPDSRMRGGTLRFWEAQYDVLLGSNFMDSPHGWTAWKIYATYYAYLLTGEEQYLVQTMNALGSCVQLVDDKTGNLRWAFATDPYISTIQKLNYPGANPDKFNDNQYSPYDKKGENVNIILGEQYLNMAADRFNANSSDNDVHEIFKCMEEVALTSVYVLKRKDGSFLTYNCTLTETPGNITIVPNEAVVNKVHFNGCEKNKVTIAWKNGKRETELIGKIMEWVNR